MSFGLETAQRKALYDWVAAIHPTTYIEWEMQDQPAEDRPRLILGITTPLRSEDRPSMSYDSEDTFRYDFKEVFTFSVTAYYDDITQNFINAVIRSQYTDTIRTALAAANLNIRYNIDPVDLSRVISTRHEYCVNVEFVIATHSAITETAGEIQTIDTITADI